jgi:hypothetical protein
MHDLEYLRLRGPAKGWVKLRDCTRLEEAHLIEVQIANLRRWNTWSQLRTLTLAGRGVKSLAGLESCQSLEQLTLLNLRMNDLAPLREMPRLTTLQLRMADTVDLESVASVGGLRTFVIDSSRRDGEPVRLQSLRPLARAAALEEVVLLQTLIEDGDLLPLADLKSLKKVRLASTIGADVGKLRAARPDVLFHTGYNPDINLFLRQSKEQGLRVRAYVGHGAGHSQLDKLKEAFGKDAEGFHTSDPPAAQLIEPSKLKPGVAAMTQEMVKRYKAFEPDIPVNNIAPHVSMGFNNLWILLNDVLPRAIQKHGGWNAEALAQAARETDIPEGGTMQGYGVKFLNEGPMRGQNERAIAAVYQVVDGQFRHVWPAVIATPNPPVLLPASSPWAAR